MRSNQTGMNMATRFIDGLTNVFSGLGTRGDARAQSYYAYTPLTQQQIAAAYRGSGLMRKIIDIPADDTVREWREWKGDADAIAAIFAEEARLSLVQKVRDAEVLRGLGGGAFILGLPGDPATPAPESVGIGGLAFLHVVSRYAISAAGWIDDPSDPLFGEPQMWRLNGQGRLVNVHPSRVVTFRGDFIPDFAAAGSLEERYWGESRVARVLSAVQDCDTARASFANLITKASRLRLGVPNLSMIVADGDGETAMSKRLASLVMGESILNASVYDLGNGTDGSGEKIDDVSYNFAGIKDVMEAYATWVAAISDIPATRLLGRAPEGMNSSGNSQQVDWNKAVRARQTLFTGPALNRIDAYLVPSATGKPVDDGLWYEFAPLDMPSRKESADTFATFMGAIDKLQATATVPDRALAQGVQSLLVEQGWLPAVEQALADMPDGERFGTDPLALGDAQPIPLYVRRDVLNGEEIAAWAKANGFANVMAPADMHVTILHSRTPVDPIAMGEPWLSEADGGLLVKAGGPRAVEQFNGGAIVLQFAHWGLSSRHADMIALGASHDWPEYMPHVTFATGPQDEVDLANLTPFQGALQLGPEIFEPINPDWNGSAGAR